MGVEVPFELLGILYHQVNLDLKWCFGEIWILHSTWLECKKELLIFILFVRPSCYVKFKFYRIIWLYFTFFMSHLLHLPAKVFFKKKKNLFPQKIITFVMLSVKRPSWNRILTTYAVCSHCGLLFWQMLIVALCDLFWL